MAQQPASTTNAGSRAKTTMASTSRSASETLGRAEDIMHSTMDAARDYTDRAREMASEAGERTVEYVRRYPINFAIGAAVVGLIAGLLLARRR